MDPEYLFISPVYYRIKRVSHSVNVALKNAWETADWQNLGQTRNKLKHKKIKM